MKTEQVNVNQLKALDNGLERANKIKLTFYSGKLWHSDKPFPKTSPDQKSWYHSAYEVVNPDALTLIVQLKDMSDGDQITLPEGYGIEVTECTTCQYKGNILVCHDNGCQKKLVTITASDNLKQKL